MSSSQPIEIDDVVEVLEELSKNYSFGIITTSRRVDFDLIHSQRGLSSAVNTGIECAVVENKFTATHDFSSATYRIKKLQELPTLLQSLKQ